MRGAEVARLDEGLAESISDRDRSRIWASAERILATHSAGNAQSTLALGYVQSGKTTSMAALCALAADNGYRVVVALLGSTNLLLNQNRARLESMLSLDGDHYTWVSLDATGANSAKELGAWLGKGRVLFLPVLKHHKQIDKLTAALGGIDGIASTACLVIDDEADQVSLNTRPDKESPSSTYASIESLRRVLKGALYVQYTATPYAPLLLDPEDSLMPTAVEFLEPGEGYTGGRQFLIDSSETVLRPIPFTDEATTKPIASLPPSLLRALAAFVAGAAILYVSELGSPPISMLVHATHRNDGQARYHFLLERFLERIRAKPLSDDDDFGVIVQQERSRLTEQGVAALNDEEFWTASNFVLRELSLWLVNSASDVKRVSWNYSPFHLLIGGNKLDRGFTVEGLTVSYMNRKPSEQIDTLEQRARAFGYRGSLLPFCQIFASPRTIRILQGVVHTEDDLRANLYDWIDAGGTVSTWAREVGLDLPVGTKPTRPAVLAALSSFNADGGWHVLRFPKLDASSRAHNSRIISSLGLPSAARVDYGRLNLRTIHLSLREILIDLLEPWACSDDSPSWQHSEILDHLRRHPDSDSEVDVMFMALDGDEARERAWRDEFGFINLFQGRDNDHSEGPRYEGDRAAGLSTVRTPDGVVVQVHYVRRKNVSEEGIFTLAMHIGDRQIVRGSGVTNG